MGGAKSRLLFYCYQVESTEKKLDKSDLSCGCRIDISMLFVNNIKGKQSTSSNVNIVLKGSRQHLVFAAKRVGTVAVQLIIEYIAHVHVARFKDKGTVSAGTIVQSLKDGPALHSTGALQHNGVVANGAELGLLLLLPWCLCLVWVRRRRSRAGTGSRWGRTVRLAR